ncbi:MAG: GDP-mannose 4,6-dehydratase [Thermoanaerobaculia bacterium]|nr:GDP-mannose 4,6-dehydratase [Thermoanaerobaculia bacterium]
MRVLITGITGFVGCHLAKRLTDRGHSVAGLATDPARSPLGVEVRSTDVCCVEALRTAVEELDPEAIVHLAGLSSVGRSWEAPGDYLRVNFGGTRNLVHVAEGRKVVFASSAEVYGKVPESEQPIAEDRPLDPRSPYAMTKACAEEVALDYDAIVVRSFNSIGPGQARHFALPSFASQLRSIAQAEAPPVLSVGDLSPRRDFLHVADAVEGYVTIVERSAPGEVYNLASGSAHSIRHALDRLRAISGVDAEVEIDPQRVRPVDVPLLQGDVSKLRSLGWSPERDLDAALEDIWQETLAAETT